MSPSPLDPPPLDFKQRAAAAAVRWFIRLYSMTYRVRVVQGADVLERIVAGERPVVFCFWHDRIFFLAPFLRWLSRRGVPLTIFTSLSRDGELVAQLALSWGADVVRGSSSRGGADGLRLLHRAIRRKKSSPVVVPDGPRGPRHVAKSGAAVLARLSGVPIVPLAYAARKARRLGSWDRLIVPRPFTRIAVVVGEPETIPRRETDDVEPYRARLEQRLQELVDAAESACGASGG